MIVCFFLNFAPLTKHATSFYHRDYMLSGMYVILFLKHKTSLSQTSGINSNNSNANHYLDFRLQISLINIACFQLFVSATLSGSIYTDARVFVLRIRVTCAFSMLRTHVRFKVR